MLGIDPSIRLINAVNSLATYLRQSAWPSGLCAFYPHPLDTARVDAWFIATALLLAAVSALALTTLLRRNASAAYVGAGWFWFVGTLVPMLGLIQLGAAAHADRYMYFPLIGLSLLVGLFVCRLWTAAPSRFRTMIAAAAYASVITLSAVSFVHASHWQSNITLFRRALAVAPDNMFSRTNLADGLMQEAQRLSQNGHADSARELLLEARDCCMDGDQIYPLPSAYFNLSTSLRLLGEIPKAIEIGLQGVQRFPEMPSMWYALGEAYREAGDADQATECYLRVLEIDSRFVDALNKLAAVNGARDPIRSERWCRQALAIDPLHVEARTNLGNSLARQGRFEEAFAEYRRALEIDPGNQEIIENISIVEEMYRDAGR